MANTDKNILITPNKGSSTNDPTIVFSGANSSVTAQNITLSVTPISNGTVAFSGSAGQLFSIVNSMSGNIFNVNDVSGVPLIQATDTGNVVLTPYGGNVQVGSSITLTGTQNSGVIVPRTYTQSGGTSISVTSGYGYRSYDLMDITSVSSNFTLTADGGSSYKSYTNGQKLMIKLTASGSISITVGSGGTYPWNQVQTVPTAMVSGQILYIGAVFNSNTSKWDIVAAKVG